MPYSTDDTNNSANERIRPSRPYTLDNSTPVVPPALEEAAIAIQRLECNKTSGYDFLSAELFKAEEMSWLAACTTFSQHMVTGKYAK